MHMWLALITLICIEQTPAELKSYAEEVRPTSITLESIKDAYRQRSNLTDNVSVSFEVFGKDSTPWVSGSYLIGRNGKYKMSETWHRSPSTASDDDRFETAWDTTHYNRLFELGNGNLQGEITFEKFSDLRPWGGLRGSGNNLLAVQLESDDTSIQLEGEVEVDGEPCVVLRFRNVRGKNTVTRCYLSQSRDFIVVRRELAYEQNDAVPFNVEEFGDYYRDTTHGGVALLWPKEVVLHEAYDGKIGQRRIVLTSAEFNVDVDPQSFSIDWPEGTSVNDTVLDRVYKAGQQDEEG